LVYYKLANLDNKILVDLSVSGEIKKFNNIEPKKSKDILKIIGVLLDNAIEAVEIADEKENIVD
jgi:sensor histidine kinase regulating citrate/malate metabolism